MVLLLLNVYSRLGGMLAKCSGVTMISHDSNKLLVAGVMTPLVALLNSSKGEMQREAVDVIHNLVVGRGHSMAIISAGAFL